MPDPLMTDAKAKLSAFETKQAGWVKRSVTPLLIGLALGAFLDWLVRTYL